MKKLIFAILAICVANADEFQKALCGDRSLEYCIEHFDRQCEAKNYVACSFLATLHLEQEKYSESKKYRELVCDKANSNDSFQVEMINGSFDEKVPVTQSMQIACSELARFYYNGLGVRQDFTKALQYHKKACDLGWADSCAKVGYEYILGENVKGDSKLAKNYYEKSCEMQYANGCFGLGAMYGYGKGLSQDLSKAKELYGKACDLGAKDGCDRYKELNEWGVK